MPTYRTRVSTDQPARYLALCAIIIACLSGAFTYLGANALATRAQRDERLTCRDLETQKALFRRALHAAIQRAVHALPDPAAQASIAELQQEIKLSAPRDCG